MIVLNRLIGKCFPRSVGSPDYEPQMRKQNAEGRDNNRDIRPGRSNFDFLGQTNLGTVSLSLKPKRNSRTEKNEKKTQRSRVYVWLAMSKDVEKSFQPLCVREHGLKGKYPVFLGETQIIRGTERRAKSL